MKTRLAVLGIAVTGGLIYALLSGQQPDRPAVVSGEPGPGSASSAAVPPPPTPEEHPSGQRTPVAHTGNDSITAPVSADRARQQAPALEPEIRAALNEMLNTSAEGLVEETRNGATSIDLQGRFQTAPVATIDENGNIQITDYSYPPGAAPQP